MNFNIVSGEDKNALNLFVEGLKVDFQNIGKLLTPYENQKNVDVDKNRFFPVLQYL